MEITFESHDLDQLECDAVAHLRFSRDVVLAFRKRLQGLRCAAGANDVFSLTSWRAVPLRSAGPGWLSLQLTPGTSLLVQFVVDEAAAEHVRVVRIDEHA